MIHQSVMLTEVVAALNVRAGQTYLDATFGRGGTSRAILERGGCVIGLDRDPQAVAAGQQLAAANSNFRMLHGNFGNLGEYIPAASLAGLAFDLGVSSPQLDEAERGFSFSRDGPLDMRMDPATPLSAADLVNRLGETELADLIYRYGEERFSRRIAAAIVARRTAQGPFSRTGELANTVRSAVRKRPDSGVDSATRTFQALRIAVNDELGELARGLVAAETALAPGGRLAVLSFHSLEDRIVKDYLKQAAGRGGSPSRHRPDTPAAPVRFKLIGKQPQLPDTAECTANPRARSARLRVAEKTGECA